MMTPTIEINRTPEEDEAVEVAREEDVTTNGNVKVDIHNNEEHVFEISVGDNESI